MKQLFLLSFFIFCFFITHAQHRFSAIITNTKGITMQGVTVRAKGKNLAVISDSTGRVVMEDLPAGTSTFLFSHVGYKEKEIKVSLPLLENEIQVIMEEAEEEEAEITVMATRTSRTLTHTPTRVDIIAGEELEEKGNMKPGDIRMLLNESTGIQTLQTSATSFNSSIRIQGLDGRYTQLLQDGFPLYSGFSGGLSIMQVAPLNLQQVEVIKGASSTLYGGGAIAGLVNLVSKVPTDERTLNFLTNVTSAGGIDLSGFYGKRNHKWGTTVFATHNSNKPFDPAGNGVTAIPKFNRFTILPKLFYYGQQTQVQAGFTYTNEDRTGGSINYIKQGGDGYFENNKTGRLQTTLLITHQLNDENTLTFKNSYNYYNRTIETPGYIFDGQQKASFSELTYGLQKEKSHWIGGLNVYTDAFVETPGNSSLLRNYKHTTLGAFVQNNWSLSRIVTLESGLRLDHVSPYGTELLPRLSALFRWSPSLTSRMGGGYGYKTPTIFNEEAERIQFKNVLPIDQRNNKNERSAGLNGDVDYKTTLFNTVRFSINQAFFYTKLQKPLIMIGAAGGKVEFVNADGYIATKGMETNVRLAYHNFKLYTGYTFTDVKQQVNNIESRYPLTARHRLNNVLMYEIEEKLKLGLEAYYFGRQPLPDGSTGASYWIAGFMGEKIWESFSIFLNFENFTDTRQSKRSPVYTGTLEAPVFADIYMPVEGFVVNGGIKLRL